MGLTVMPLACRGALVNEDGVQIIHLLSSCIAAAWRMERAEIYAEGECELVASLDLDQFLHEIWNQRLKCSILQPLEHWQCKIRAKSSALLSAEDRMTTEGAGPVLADSCTCGSLAADAQVAEKAASLQLQRPCNCRRYRLQGTRMFRTFMSKMKRWSDRQR